MAVVVFFVVAALAGAFFVVAAFLAVVVFFVVVALAGAFFVVAAFLAGAFLVSVVLTVSSSTIGSFCILSVDISVVLTETVLVAVFNENTFGPLSPSSF